MSQTSMKQLGSRNMGCVIERMEWSNKMDLIAFGNEKGEIIVQRLNWQKIVTFPPPAENVRVRSLSWQLDETVLAVGYSNGKVSLVDVEREDDICSFDYESDIHNVYFSKPIKITDYRNAYRNKKEHNYDFFLPALPQLNGLDLSSANGKGSVSNQKSFAKGPPSFLVITLTNGKVHLLLLGALNAGSIDLSQHLVHSNDFRVFQVRLSGDFKAIYALVRDGNQLKVLHFYNTLLQECLSPMLHLAVDCANIAETKNYINETIQSVLEAWETVLLEMDNKLTKYANQQPEGQLSADFLELLVFGYATHEIEEFLMDELTEKGVKKLANSVDLSYSTIQNLVAKPLQSASVNMFYFLNNLKGLARLTYFFEPLLSTEASDKALRSCGSFLIKVMELQQVIDQCVTDMKLFFSWLCVCIIRLHQQDIPEDITQITPEETIYLAEYLNSFEDSVVENEDGSSIKRKFNLEKVGQYLEDKPLQQSSKSDIHHMWNNLLEENECLRECTLLHPHEKQCSLIQQRNKLFEAIDILFQKPNDTISENFKLVSSFMCCELPCNDIMDDDFVRCCYNVCETLNCDYLLTTIGWQDLLLLQFEHQTNELKCTQLHLRMGPFTPPMENINFEYLRFVDLQFYNENILSMLLQSPLDAAKSSTHYNFQSHFVQFSLESARSKSSHHILPQHLNLTDLSVAHSIHDLCDSSSSMRNIEAECTQLAVSGSRKVATLLADECKKMIVFEMEIEDDDDEVDISQNSMLEMSKDSTMSMHE